MTNRVKNYNFNISTCVDFIVFINAQTWKTFKAVLEYYM
jgi:hypothetical protein